MNYATVLARPRRMVVPAIVIATQPQSVTSGGSATFSVSAAASNGSPLQYQWQVSSDSGATWSAVSGATSSSLTVSGLTAGESGYRYRVEISAGGLKTVTSNSATYTFIVVITITQQPVSQVSSGGAASFSASATTNDGSDVSYQWQQSTNGGVSFFNVSGATSSTLSLTGLTTSSSGYRYRIVVSASGAASVTSNAATLTVPQPSVTITEQPTQWMEAAGETGGYSWLSTQVTATISNPEPSSTLTYTWQISDDGLSGWQNLQDVWGDYFGYYANIPANKLTLGYKGFGLTQIDKFIRCQIGVSPTGIGANSNNISTPSFF